MCAQNAIKQELMRVSRRDTPSYKHQADRLVNSRLRQTACGVVNGRRAAGVELTQLSSWRSARTDRSAVRWSGSSGFWAHEAGFYPHIWAHPQGDLPGVFCNKKTWRHLKSIWRLTRQKDGFFTATLSAGLVRISAKSECFFPQKMWSNHISFISVKVILACTCFHSYAWANSFKPCTSKRKKFFFFLLLTYSRVLSVHKSFKEKMTIIAKLISVESPHLKWILSTPIKLCLVILLNKFKQTAQIKATLFKSTQYMRNHYNWKCFCWLTVFPVFKLFHNEFNAETKHIKHAINILLLESVVKINTLFSLFWHVLGIL